MDYKQREEIFSKEALSIEDVRDLYGVSYGTASDLIRTWKRKCNFKHDGLRIDIQGKIHVLDYFKALGIDSLDWGLRYQKDREVMKEQERILHENRSICLPKK